MGNTLLPDKEVVTYLLNGLGSSFEPLITSVTSQTKPLTSHELFQLFIIHESCLSHRNRSTISSRVLFVNFNPSTNRNQRGHSSFRSRRQGCGRGWYFPNNGRGGSHGGCNNFS